MNPLFFNEVVVTHLEHSIGTLDAFICDEAKSTRFVCLPILEDDDVLDVPELLKVGSKAIQC